jgi:hypothetical protein
LAAAPLVQPAFALRFSLSATKIGAFTKRAG